MCYTSFCTMATHCFAALDLGSQPVKMYMVRLRPHEATCPRPHLQPAQGPGGAQVAMTPGQIFSTALQMYNLDHVSLDLPAGGASSVSICMRLVRIQLCCYKCKLLHSQILPRDCTNSSCQDKTDTVAMSLHLHVVHARIYMRAQQLHSTFSSRFCSSANTRGHPLQLS